MPKKRVTVKAVMVRGRQYHRIIIPIELCQNRKRKCRFFAKKTDADTFANRLEVQRLAFKDGAFTVQEQAELFRLVTVAGGMEGIHRAVDFYLKNKPADGVSLKRLAQDCIQEKMRGKVSKAYVDQLEVTFKRFNSIHGDKQAHEMTAQELSDYLHGNLWRVETIRSNLKNLRTLFSYGVSRGHLLTNPAMAVTMPSSEDKPPGILPVKSVREFLAKVLKEDATMAPFIALSLFGGLRPSEAARITRDDLKRGHIEVAGKKAKTRQRRLVTINQTLKAWLTLKGPLPPGSEAITRKRMRKLKAGMTWPSDCLRHSFVSYHLAKYQDAGKTALEAGHTQQVLFAHYRELVTKKEADEFWKLTPKSVLKP